MIDLVNHVRRIDLITIKKVPKFRFFNSLGFEALTGSNRVGSNPSKQKDV